MYPTECFCLFDFLGGGLSQSRIFHSYGDITITSEGLLICNFLQLCSNLLGVGVSIGVAWIEATEAVASVKKNKKKIKKKFKNPEFLI